MNMPISSGAWTWPVKEFVSSHPVQQLIGSRQSISRSADPDEAAAISSSLAEFESLASSEASTINITPAEIVDLKSDDVDAAWGETEDVEEYVCYISWCYFTHMAESTSSILMLNVETHVL